MKGESMKNIILIISGMFIIVTPVYAVCSITGGACTASSNWESKPLEQRLVPDNLQELQRTDAFRPVYITPYYDMLINTEQDVLPPENNYNSNCQFGVCMPGQTTGAGAELTE